MRRRGEKSNYELWIMSYELRAVKGEKSNYELWIMNYELWVEGKEKDEEREKRKRKKRKREKIFWSIKKLKGEIWCGKKNGKKYSGV